MTGFVGNCAIALTIVGSALAQGKWYPEVLNDGTPAGELLNVSGTQIYQSYPALYSKNSTPAVLFVTDIYGLPLLQNKLLADSIAKAGYLVVLPDLFKGDAIPVQTPEGGLNLTAWRLRHSTDEIDSIIASTIKYIQTDLGAKKIGGVGYCFGGKYVPRFLAEGKGLDAGFIAHPSGLETAEIQAIAHPITIAAGELDTAFNVTGRHAAESILQTKNATYQLNLYSGAPHGFAVRPDLSVPRQKYAKETAFFQAVRWFDAWL
ncbi:dienelactone hydrolase family-domain-containing protein [Lophiotrema nucula]|uniref:Dienelactone hydrolase family-domain-containing protein n=1 Tax=Lophiotrema nucula TaxID=690887 RepID=A0A6A5ZEM3_9PLEO|nr:dienelactone hydrolase family-domain-containing protein [Lophiotrema nucula]